METIPSPKRCLLPTSPHAVTTQETNVVLSAKIRYYKKEKNYLQHTTSKPEKYHNKFMLTHTKKRFWTTEK